MGDYDWHIASDTNTWSDQLYRIYGYEPQSFNASYERFLANIHPDDLKATWRSLRALMAGAPLIATRTGAIPEFAEGAAILIEPEAVVGKSGVKTITTMSTAGTASTSGRRQARPAKACST